MPPPNLQVLQHEVEGIKEQVTSMSDKLDKFLDVNQEQILTNKLKILENEKSIERLWSARKDDKKRNQNIQAAVIGGVLTAVALAIMGLN